MLLIELNYTAPIEEIDAHLVAHRDFLQAYYDKGILLASGPKNPRTGGIVIAMTDKATMGIIIKEDPFYVHGLAEYRVTEFDAVKYADVLAPLLSE